MKKTTVVSLRITPEMLDRIDAATDNRAAFILEAIKLKLDAPALTDVDKRNILKGAKNLNDFMQDAIMAEAERRRDFLSTMSNDDFARLVAGRLPKEQQENQDMEANVLSLRSCLDRLPHIVDISAELNRTKIALHKAEFERDVNKNLLKHSREKTELKELMTLVWHGAVRYSADLIARHNLPGFGDGGGVNDAAYAMTAEAVQRELEALEIGK